MPLQVGIGSGSLELLIDGELSLKRGQRASLRLLDEDRFSDGIEVEIVRLSRDAGRLGARYIDPTEEQLSMIRSISSKADDGLADLGIAAEPETVAQTYASS